MDVRRDGGETAVVQVGEAALAGPMDFLRSVVVPQSGEKVQCMGPIARGYERCTRTSPIRIQNIQLTIYTCSHDGHQTRTFRNGETTTVALIM